MLGFSPNREVARQVWHGLLAAVLLLGLGHAAGAAETASIAGQVELVEGEVKVVDAKGVERVPQAGDKVWEGDTLHCGNDGELHVRMLDEAFIALRANTQLKITRYLAQGGDSDSAVFSLLKGTFRSITGWIGKLNRKNYAVQTPNATLGIRGTDHEPLYVAEGAADVDANPPGTYDKVNAGGTVIQSSFGTIEVAPEQVGFAPLRAAPRLLPRTPGFYARTKHERRIDERKEQLQRHMDQRPPGADKPGAEKPGEGGGIAPDGIKPGEAGGAAPDGAKPARKAERLKDAIRQNDGNGPDLKNHKPRRPHPPRPPPK